MKIKFKWYDMWVGVFYDRIKRTFYICPLPMIVIIVKRKDKKVKKDSSFSYDIDTDYVPDWVYNGHHDCGDK